MNQNVKICIIPSLRVEHCSYKKTGSSERGLADSPYNECEAGDGHQNLAYFGNFYCYLANAQYNDQFLAICENTNDSQRLSIPCVQHTQFGGALICTRT